MSWTRRWSVVFFASTVLSSVASASVPVLVRVALPPSGTVAAMATSTPDLSAAVMVVSEASWPSEPPPSAALAVPAVRAGQDEIVATAETSDEVGASLGQILASWGLVACIVLRRIVD